MKVLAKSAIIMLAVVLLSACNTVERYQEEGLAGAGALNFTPETEENWRTYSNRSGPGLFMLTADGKESLYTYCRDIRCKETDPAFRIWACENSLKKPCFIYAANGTIVWDTTTSTSNQSLGYKLTGEADASHKVRTGLSLPVYFSWQDLPAVKKATLSFDTPWTGNIQFEKTADRTCQGKFALRDQLMNFVYHGRWIVHCTDGNSAMGITAFRFTNPSSLVVNDLKVTGTNSQNGETSFSLKPY